MSDNVMMLALIFIGNAVLLWLWCKAAARSGSSAAPLATAPGNSSSAADLNRLNVHRGE
jgi:hypothetical protein